MYQRNIIHSIDEAFADTPVIFLLGARQTGKSTLARHIAEREGIPYRTLDNATVLAAAASDPEGFLRSLGERAVIDEVQRVPEMLVAIKASVDANRKAGRYLLTGSSNIMTLPRVSESLAGRMELLVLKPLSQGEVQDRRDSFVDVVFTETPKVAGENSRERLVERVIRGGYPEVYSRETQRRRDAWFGSYLSTVLQRDVRDVANIEGLTDLPRLFSILALRTAGLLNYSELSRTSGVPQSTLKRYLGILQTIFLYEPLEAWSANRDKRLVKAPKIHLPDSGLTASLIGFDADRADSDIMRFGPLLENFVVNELRKQISWAMRKYRLYHFRTAAGAEVDGVIEAPDGHLVGVEVTGTASVKAADFRGLRSLSEEAGRRFIRGLILYDGKETVSFEERFAAVPISALWLF